MQRMHQSYKCMKAQQKKLVGVHPTCLLTKTQDNLRKPIIGIYKPSSIMKNSHQYMKVISQETFYHEDHGATLKHKCGKRIVTLSLLSFSLIFWAFSFLWPFSFFIPHLGQCSNNDDHHTSIYLQLNDYNSILKQSMTLYECLRRCTGICNESRVTCTKNYEGGLATNTMSTT